MPDYRSLHRYQHFNERPWLNSKFYNAHVLLYCTTLMEICLSDNATKQLNLLRVCCFWNYFVPSPCVVSGPMIRCGSSLLCEFC